jgi:tRNA-dihydrouridine synthase B
MGISFENLDPPKWGGPVPERAEREPCVLGPDLVIDSPVVLSPMAAVTNPPYRMICREMGAGLVVTEMIHARKLCEGDERTWKMLDIRPSEHPVSVQLFGNDPGALGEAAAIVAEHGADAVDLNMGCPMRKVVSGGCGAGLLEKPKLINRIFRAMSEAVDVPVTGKIRAGWEESCAVEVGRAMQDGGAAAVTIHGRTRSEMYDGHVDLAVIAELKEAVDMVVVGNGDVRDWQSARRMFHTTGCDAVMVARGALGNPWVFREISADLRGEPVPAPPTLDEKRKTLARHVDLYIETFGEERTRFEIRKHLLWYFRHTPGEKTLRRTLSDLESRADIMQAVDAACEACRQAEDASDAA